MRLSARSGLVRSLIILNLFLSIFWSFYSLRFKRLWHVNGWVERRRRELYAIEARRFRITAVELGGLLIKLGQFFSTRVDILPQESIRELSGLQDEVSAVDFGSIKQLIEAEFGRPLEAIFSSMEEVPVASASLGQVHRGTLEQGQLVAIKVQRPGIDRLIKIDLKAIAKVVSMVKRFTDWERFVDLDAIYEEFADTLQAELDYVQEGKNAETIAGNSQHDPDLLIPHIMWDYTRRKVLTMEYLEGIKITDLDAIQGLGFDRKALAEKLLQTYVRQVLVDGFFHADPHPGNLFVSSEGKLIMVDFGMVGSIAPHTRDTLVEVAVSLVKRDFTKVLSGLQQVGFIRPGAESGPLIRALSLFIEHFLGSGQDISSQDLTTFLQDLEVLLYEQPFQVPANFTFLGRALGTLYGICVALDPEISFLDVGKPYVEEVAPADAGWWSLVKDKASRAAYALVELPPLSEAVLRRAERGDLSVKIPMQPLKDAINDNTRATRMVAWAIVFGFTLLSSVYLMVNHYVIESRYGLALALLFLIIAWRNDKRPDGRRAPHPPVMVRRK